MKSYPRSRTWTAKASRVFPYPREPRISRDNVHDHDVDGKRTDGIIRYLCRGEGRFNFEVTDQDVTDFKRNNQMRHRGGDIPTDFLRKYGINQIMP